MKDLVILGTGVHAAEMAEIVERVNRSKKTWAFRGFLAPDRTERRKELNGYPVLGSYEDLPKIRAVRKAFFVPANTWHVNKLPLAPGRYATLVDPTVFVSKSARLGSGCVFYPGCFIGLNAQVGNFVFALAGSIINHDDVIGERVILTSGVVIAGMVTVGEGSYLGQGCVIRQKLRVGARSLIGMGAVVVKDVPPQSVMAGNPARLLKKRSFRI